MLVVAQVWFVAGFASAAVRVGSPWLQVACGALAAFLAYRAVRTTAEIRRRSQRATVPAGDRAS